MTSSSRRSRAGCGQLAPPADKPTTAGRRSRPGLDAAAQVHSPHSEHNGGSVRAPLRSVRDQEALGAGEPVLRDGQHPDRHLLGGQVNPGQLKRLGHLRLVDIDVGCHSLCSPVRALLQRRRVRVVVTLVRRVVVRRHPSPMPAAHRGRPIVPCPGTARRLLPRARADRSRPPGAATPPQPRDRMNLCGRAQPQYSVRVNLTLTSLRTGPHPALVSP